MTFRLLVLGALVLLAISAPAPEAAPQRDGIPFRIGQPFPDLSLPDVEGNRRSIADFRGHKLILHIFASW